jgi:carboxymethylenebutenolidase
MSYANIAVSGGEMAAYVANPLGTPKAALVLIQEIFGVNAVMRSLADGFAEQGYLCVCPDLFWRIEPGVDITDKSEAEWKRAFELFNAFDVDTGVEDIAATALWARAAVNGDKIGCVGYCLGGKLAFLAAQRAPVQASVSYYGVGLDALVQSLTPDIAPLLLHVASEDRFVPAAAQAVIKAGVASHPRITLHVYEGCDHAFARVGGEHFNAAAALLANARTASFLAQHLA